MKGLRQKGSYTVEAAFYVPMLIFIMITALQNGINFLEECREREIYHGLTDLDLVSEFYNYQSIEEVEEEMQNDQS